MHTEEIDYWDGDTLCRGFVAYNKQSTQPMPCVMIAHDWSGRNEMLSEKAVQLASLGFVGFAIDMYGDAKIGNTNEEKMMLYHPLVMNRPQVAARMLAAFNTVAALSFVDKSKIAAMGYCFGGLCVLDLARAGADVKGVVSFHGTLTTPEQTVAEKILAKILVLHGYDDPLVPLSQVKQFADEMTLKKSDWQIHMYGHTQHSFTNPQANDDTLGLHYNAKADRRSWLSAIAFLQEIFNN